jgi:hypothetical protein
MRFDKLCYIVCVGAVVGLTGMAICDYWGLIG